MRRLEWVAHWIQLANLFTYLAFKWIKDFSQSIMLSHGHDLSLECAHCSWPASKKVVPPDIYCCNGSFNIVCVYGRTFLNVQRKSYKESIHNSQSLFDAAINLSPWENDAVFERPFTNHCLFEALELHECHVDSIANSVRMMVFYVYVDSN